MFYKLLHPVIIFEHLKLFYNQTYTKEFLHSKIGTNGNLINFAPYSSASQNCYLHIIKPIKQLYDVIVINKEKWT